MLELLALPFFQRSLLVGLILGSILAVLGVFVVLRRLTFFSDAIGHSALTGIALGLLVSINPFVGALAFSLLVAGSIATMRRYVNLALDTLLGVFFAASVSLGVILMQRLPGYQTDLFSFLFGDILTVGQTDVVMSLLLAFIVGVVMFFAGKAFISIAFNQDLAQAEGIAVPYYELLFLLVLAGAIALAIKFVGVVLVTAMLIIPAAAAQNLARSVSHLFSLSVLFSLISIVVGMLVSALAQTASGPTIVLTGSVLFALSLGLKPVFAR